MSPIAAEIMVAETNTMIWATKQLFYAILDFRMDESMAGSDYSHGIMEQVIGVA
ncbi:MAG: hypothetical protein Q4C57_12035 [Bacillota bacterium]|nr:hypothetical protein [Bacillota bacterium]